MASHPSESASAKLMGLRAIQAEGEDRPSSPASSDDHDDQPNTQPRPRHRLHLRRYRHRRWFIPTCVVLAIVCLGAIIGGSFASYMKMVRRPVEPVSRRLQPLTTPLATFSRSSHSLTAHGQTQITRRMTMYVRLPMLDQRLQPTDGNVRSSPTASRSGRQSDQR